MTILCAVIPCHRPATTVCRHCAKRMCQRCWYEQMTEAAQHEVRA